MRIDENTKHITRQLVGAYVQGATSEDSWLRYRLKTMSDRDFKRFFGALQGRVRSKERDADLPGGNGFDFRGPDEILKQALALGVNLRDVLASCPTRKSPNLYRGLR